jgi:pantetheine-phosphate adenylyltransferase
MIVSITSPLALYCGSFKPFHIGHLNILRKAEAIFGDNVVVCRGVNPDKSYEDTEKITDVSGIKALSYKGFTHELIEKLEQAGHNVVLVRGLRNGHDLDYESNQIAFIKSFKPDLKVIYIPCDKEFEHISSSAIRNLESFRKGSAENLIVRNETRI